MSPWREKDEENASRAIFPSQSVDRGIKKVIRIIESFYFILLTLLMSFDYEVECLIKLMKKFGVAKKK